MFSCKEKDNIKNQFFQDAIDYIDSIEANLLELENNKDDDSLINDTFRGFHTLKGNSGLAQENDINTICHETESILDMVRKNKLELDQENLRLFFEALDIVRKIVDYKNSSKFFSDIENFLYKLKVYRDKITSRDINVSWENNKQNFVSDLNILKKIASQYLELVDLMANIQLEDKYWDTVESIMEIAINLNDIIPNNISFKTTSKYFEKILQLIYSCDVHYNKNGYEIINEIIQDIRNFVLDNIILNDNFIIVSINNFKELELIKGNKEMLDKQLIFLELRLPMKHEISFEEDKLFEVFEEIRTIYCDKVRFISYLNKEIIKKSRFISELGFFKGIINKDMFEAIIE